MHLLPELATQHAVSIPELLASRDKRLADTPLCAAGLVHRGCTGSD